MRELVFEKLDPIIESQIQEALGIFYEKLGGKKIYRKLPNAKSAELLLFYGLGKPPQSEPERHTVGFANLDSESLKHKVADGIIGIIGVNVRIADEREGEPSPALPAEREV